MEDDKMNEIIFLGLVVVNGLMMGIIGNKFYKPSSAVKTCVVGCFDERLLRFFVKICKKIGIGNVHFICIANPVMELARPDGRATILKSIKIAVQHGHRVFKLYDHVDCSYRRGKLGGLPIDKDKEIKILIKDLNLAELIIREAFPDVMIKKYILDKKRRWEATRIP